MYVKCYTELIRYSVVTNIFNFMTHLSIKDFDDLSAHQLLNTALSGTTTANILFVIEVTEKY